ncbi:MAG TPA: hypothetical protein VN903_22785 [Polyangia bacterium]|jgi:hypothetical protein|nr:hypothetical protein [Polyangia bacterium]
MTRSFLMALAFIALVTPAIASQSSAYDRLKAHEPPERIFSAENRNESWATRIESAIRGALGRDLHQLVPKATIAKLDCRTTICELHIKRASEDDAEVQKTLNMVPPARGFMRRADANGEAVYFLVFDDDMRSPDKYEDWYRKMRAKRLARLRSAPHPDDPVPSLDKLPKE